VDIESFSSVPDTSLPELNLQVPVRLIKKLSFNVLSTYVRYLILFYFYSVPWIRIDFNADPDPAFYLNADPEWCQANADPALDQDPCQSMSQKVEFIQEKYF
jgi:hypothetical protein